MTVLKFTAAALMFASSMFVSVPSYMTSSSSAETTVEEMAAGCFSWTEFLPWCRKHAY